MELDDATNILHSEGLRIPREPVRKLKASIGDNTIHLVILDLTGGGASALFLWWHVHKRCVDEVA